MFSRALSCSGCYLTSSKSLLPLNSHAFSILQKRRLHIYLGSLIRDNLGLHEIVRPELLWEAPANGSFLDLEPDMTSRDYRYRRFFGVVTWLPPTDEEFRIPFADVKTLDGFEVRCTTAYCDGVGRLRIGLLVQIRHHLWGDHAGRTFVECTAEQCTPKPSVAGSRSPSPEPPRTPPGPGGDWRPGRFTRGAWRTT